MKQFRIKKTLSIIISVLCICAVIAAIASIGIRTALARADARQFAKTDFAAITASLTAASEANQLANTALRDQLMQRYASDSSLLLLAIFEKAQGIVWAIPSQSPYLNVQQSTGEIPAINSPQYVTIILTNPLPNNSPASLSVYALYTIVDQAKVFGFFRDALLGLGLFLLVICVIIIASTQRSAPMAVKLDRQFLARKDDSSQDGILLKSDRVDPISTRTGLTREIFLADRLEKELERCTENEELSLLVISLQAAQADPEIFQQAAKTVLRYIMVRDFVFEIGKADIAVMLPKINSGMALERVRAIAKLIADLAAQLRTRYTIGLTSRAGRKIHARTLIDEVLVAQDLASREKESTVMVFKPDAERYNEVVLSQ